MSPLHIEEIPPSARLGNALLAQGAFGEVAIAIAHHQEKERISSTSASNSRAQYAAVKNIRKATAVPHRGTRPSFGGSVAGDDWSLGARRTTHHPANVTSELSEENGPRLTKEVFCELVALQGLSGHPCITPLLSSYASSSDDPFDGFGTSLSLAFPYCPIDLADVIQQRRVLPGGRIPVTIVKAVARDILLGVQHCHAHGVLHRDVKPANLMISLRGRVQLTDFGLAKAVPSFISNSFTSSKQNSKLVPPRVNASSSVVPIEEEADVTMTHALCTLHYRPPETLLGSTHYTPSVDIWAVGLVLAEIINLQPLFPGSNVLDQTGRIFALLGTPTTTHWSEAQTLPDYHKVQFVPQLPRRIEEAVPHAERCRLLGNLLQSTIALDPKKRAGASECLHEPWFFQRSALLASPQEVAAELIPNDRLVPEVLFLGSGDNDDGSMSRSSGSYRPNLVCDVKQEAVTFAGWRRSGGKKEGEEKMRTQSLPSFQMKMKSNGLLSTLRCSQGP
mmetsp:Transcript_8357/g.12248  ORF Transcript_8357/g.12248 Transcript_8357/m.12248 type:complete len:505 (-) Transcript_8357:376-1890(-)